MKARSLLGVAVLALVGFEVSADCSTNAYGDVYCGAGRCVRDHTGAVWCSRHYQGGALITRDGRAVCGTGQCAKSTRGEIYCSSVVGGAVLKDSRGQVRCQDRCELATAAQCESTRADSGG